MSQTSYDGMIYTQALLNAWGRWSQHRIGGYPAAWSMASNIKGTGEPPEGVIAVDTVIAVIGMDPTERHLQRRLIVHYQRDCAIRELLKRLEIHSRRYYDELEEAQWAVHVRLTV